MRTFVILIESFLPICQFTSEIKLHLFELTLFVHIGDIFCVGVRLELIYIYKYSEYRSSLITDVNCKRKTYRDAIAYSKSIVYLSIFT